MANIDQLIISIWQKSDSISSQNFKSLLHELLTLKTIPDANELIKKLKIPQPEQQIVAEIINDLKEYLTTNKKHQSTLFRALSQLKEDFERIEQNIANLPQFLSKESGADRIPNFWKINIPHLHFNKKQEKVYSIFSKIYNNKVTSSFKLAESLCPILTQQQKDAFAKYFKRFNHYLNFKNELLKEANLANELEKLHVAYENQDVNKAYSFINYITDIHNRLTQSAQRQFENVKWYMPVWTLVTYLKKNEDLYKNNATLQQLCNEYGLDNTEFKEFFDKLLKQLNETQQRELNKLFQPYFSSEKRSAEESDDDVSDLEEESFYGSKKPKKSESKNTLIPANAEFDLRIKNASEEHIPKSSTFNYPKYSQHLDMTDANGKKYKMLRHRIIILPRAGISKELAYQEGLAIKEYLKNRCKLSANSAKNILVQPIKQDSTWEETNRYKLMHNNTAVEFDCTIGPQEQVGVVVVRGQTITRVVAQYHELPPEKIKDKSKHSKNPSSVLSKPAAKKAKPAAATSETHIPLSMLADASTCNSSTTPAPEKSTAIASAPTTTPIAASIKSASIAAPPRPAPETHGTSTDILHQSLALFGTPKPKAPTPYQVNASTESAEPLSQVTASSVKSSTSSSTPITPIQPQSDDIIEISDDETKEIRKQLEQARNLLAEKQRQLDVEKAKTEQHRFNLLAVKKRKDRESLDKINADLQAAQAAITAEQQRQEKILKKSEELNQELQDASTSSPILQGKKC